MTHCKFRIIDGSWGIAINIIGESYFLDKYELPNGVIVVSNIAILLPRMIFIGKNEKRAIINGILWVYKEIEEKTNFMGKILVINLRKIEIFPTDYQIEGLFYSIAEWCSIHFDFEIPKFNYHFDRAQNKYIFEH